MLSLFIPSPQLLASRLYSHKGSWLRLEVGIDDGAELSDRSGSGIVALASLGDGNMDGRFENVLSEVANEARSFTATRLSSAARDCVSCRAVDNQVG
jgi:hypothetical protein